LTKQLIRLLRPYPWALPLVLILGTLSSLGEGIGISMFIPLVSSLLSREATRIGAAPLIAALDGIFSSVPPGIRMAVICGAIVISIAAKSSLSYVNSSFSNWLDSSVSCRLRTELFSRLLETRYSVFEGIPQSKFYHALNIQAWRTSEALHSLLDLLVFACTIAVYLVLLLLISWKLTFFALAALLFISWLTRSTTRFVTTAGIKCTEKEKALDMRIVEGISAMREIRAFGRETYESDRFGGTANQLRKIAWRLSNLQSMVTPLQELLAVLLLVSILLLGGIRTAGDLAPMLVFMVLLYRLQPGFVGFERSRVHMMSLAGDVNSILALLVEIGELPRLTGKTQFTRLANFIQFEDVEFSYRDDSIPALRHTSFRIPAGRETALVGPSGSGKSTVLNLIIRFYVPTGGKILIDGKDLEEFDISTWRARIAVVNQDPFFFNTTIRDNIAYGKDGASSEEIIEAAIKAHAHEFISQLPDGYSSLVGDRGSLLSAGQRQRLALSRAMIRDPEILILDEATNALDSISESAVRRSLEELRREKTIIVIAHRLSTVERADNIIVLEQGKVAEEGDFHRLINNNGLFAKMYRLQHQGMLQ
jgi:subfamily B ATP-binding cassette protein MsbA